MYIKVQLYVCYACLINFHRSFVTFPIGQVLIFSLRLKEYHRYPAQGTSDFVTGLNHRRPSACDI